MPAEDLPDVLEQPADGTPHRVVGFRGSEPERVIVLSVIGLSNRAARLS
jgi:hypothetical protein